MPPWDPGISDDELIEILRDVPGVDNPTDERDLVIHELKSAGLIVQYGWDYGPSDDFFARTDVLFQVWNPAEDAVELCRRGLSSEKRINLAPLDRELQWGPRRMNAAIGFLKHRHLVDDRHGMMNDPYLNHEVYLTPEATFFLEEHVGRS